MPKKSDTGSTESQDAEVIEPKDGVAAEPTMEAQPGSEEAEVIGDEPSIFSEENLTANDVRIIERYAMYSACGGLIPLPLLDFGVLFTVQIKMILDLADSYGVRIDKNRTKMVLAAIVGGAVPQLAREGTAMGLASAAKAVPGIGTGVGMVVASTVAYIETRLIGRVFANHFREGKSIVDIDTDKVKDWFARSKDKLTRKKKDGGADNVAGPEAAAAAEA